MGRAGTAIATIAVCAIGLLIGAAASFFTAGVALFSDGPGPFGRFYLVAVGAAVLFLLGMVGGFAAPERWRAWGICLGLPVIPVTLLFGEFYGRPDWLGWVLLGVSFILSFLAASLFGSWLGAAVRRRPREKHAGRIPSAN